MRYHFPPSEDDMHEKLNSIGDMAPWKKALSESNLGKFSAVLEGGYGLSGKNIACIKVGKAEESRGAVDSDHSRNSSFVISSKPSCCGASAVVP
mmetsp:Transcript_23443/g.36193  ORF Transcript_23443/g.36193 Transcript_23443/m.36193 type:complete len:94 (-) Transcript_23443:1056-1337(-)